MNLQTTIATFFVKSIVKSRDGRAHLLNQIAEGEEQGEQRIFDEAIALVDDDKLRKMIRRHREDELRHGRMFRAILDDMNAVVDPVPEHLDMLRTLDRNLGNFFEGGLETDHDVMMAFVILQVIEERACEQFEVDIAAFQSLGEDEIAQTFRQIADDEARHLKYCRAIALRYAKDPSEYDRALAHVREVEAKSFRDVQRANVEYLIDNGMVTGLAKAMFRVLGVLAQRANHVPYTRFYVPGAAPLAA